MSVVGLFLSDYVAWKEKGRVSSREGDGEVFEEERLRLVKDVERDVERERRLDPQCC